ncbi:hypothetical protein [Moraxella sp. ZY210820]|uniref:hypothetical protein n=1 Tax=Moraxella sp. ZY210820 TaxID=2904123 RepID=UPI0027311C2A|nr:hypothetical protein [Moraxella sp. ZY210820]WLF84803.1 hypothetical protein LU301_04900 [Moraxella sp. ZY210820]
MSETKFKIGDKVYCPCLTTNILKVVASENSPNLVAIENNNKLIDITIDGKIWSAQGMVNDVFPATQEWYELLSKLYPDVDFEKPTVCNDPKGVIKAMFDSGIKYIICKVENDVRNENLEKSTTDVIHGFNVLGNFMGFNGIWEKAEPITQDGKFIIGFADGEVVLESENE